MLRQFYQRYVPREDRIILLLLLISFFISFVYISGNMIWTHFSGEWYIPIHWLFAFPVVILLYGLALYSMNTTPRVAFFTRSYSLYFFIFVALAMLTMGLQYTPFPRIDRQLIAADRALGFHSIAVLNWTYAHWHFKNFMQDVYATMGYQLFFIPLMIALLTDKQYISRYFFAIIISYLIGSTIYYFFPTTGPASIFHSAHFTMQQHDTLLKYSEVHHHHPVTTFAGGMIAFPSFHVIWAILLTYATYRRIWLFVPVAILNALVIASTLFLAWHYLADVIAGFVVAGIAIVAAEVIVRRYLSHVLESDTIY